MKSPSPSSKPYEHTPLQHARNIRVIHLSPVRDYSRPLRCKIQQVSIDDPDLIYTALSYSWDAEEPVKPLLCDGKRLLITPNCESALQTFSKIPAGQIMWVDSICIDQGSNDERNHQVRLMGEIYSRAASVLVWLGELDDTAMAAFDQIRKLGEAHHSAALASQRFHTETTTGENMIPHLFRRSWFQRMWVIQEACLPSPDKVYVFCGSAHIRWKHLLLGTQLYRESQPEDTSIQCMDAFRLITSLLQRCADNVPVNAETERPISQILAATAEKKCQDERDRTFALYSVFDRLGLHLTAPDYNLEALVVSGEMQVQAANHERCGLIHVEKNSRWSLRQDFQVKEGNDFELYGSWQLYMASDAWFPNMTTGFVPELYSLCQRATIEDIAILSQENQKTQQFLYEDLLASVPEAGFMRFHRMCKALDKILTFATIVSSSIERYGERFHLLVTQINEEEVKGETSAWIQGLARFARLSSDVQHTRILSYWFQFYQSHTKIHARMSAVFSNSRLFTNETGIVIVSNKSWVSDFDPVNSPFVVVGQYQGAGLPITFVPFKKQPKTNGQSVYSLAEIKGRHMPFDVAATSQIKITVKQAWGED